MSLAQVGRLGLAALMVSAAAALPTAQQGGLGNRPPAPPMLVEEVILAADRMRADRWYPADTSVGDYQSGRHNRAVDMDMLVLASQHPRPELRYIAVREFGRFETPANVVFLRAFLDDPEPGVRIAAADALVQSVFGRPEATVEAAMAVQAIEERLKREVLSPTRADLWMRLAELPLPMSVAVRYEREWLAEIDQVRNLREPAAAALLRLAQTQADRTFEAATEKSIERWAETGLSQGSEEVMIGFTSRGSTLQFLRILQAMRTDNDRIAVEAATFTCKPLPPPCGNGIRDLGARLLNPHNPNHIPALERAAKYRIDVMAASTAIRKLMQAPRASLCHLLDMADGLPAERDVVAALERTEPEVYEACLDWDPVIRLMGEAQALVERTVGASWVVPATALETLARRFVETKEEGERLETVHRLNVEVASRHLRWEVRATAARVARHLEQIRVLTTLAEDDHPNVRAEVIRSLVALQSPLRWTVAIDALTESSDAHLIITAAESLREVPDMAAAREALTLTLARLTREDRDTTRRARLALIDRLVEVIPPGEDADVQVHPLRPLLADGDPVVAAAVAEALGRITGYPAYARPTRRETMQPRVDQIMTIPSCISFDLEGEVRPLTVLLDRLTAPLAIVRMVELIEAGYYNGTTLYFVDENVARGGNPADNDEGGIARFIRDEVGGDQTGPHLALAAHDRDTADGRLIFRYRQNPSVHRHDTILGRVVTPRVLTQGTLVTRTWVGAPEDIRRKICGGIGIPRILAPSE